MSEEDSYYSNDEEYFLDLCRGNELQELKLFVGDLPETSEFNWGWFTNTGDNFIHMIAANNLTEVFDFVFPVLAKRCPKQMVYEILNKRNSSLNTPLHYAVVTDSKEMAQKLIAVGADTEIVNEHNRTALEQAEKFQKYEIAQILAPITKANIQQLKKQVGDLKLNDDDESSQEELPKMIPMESIKQEQQETPKDEGKNNE